MSLSFGSCKTYPSDTLVIQKITFTEQKAKQDEAEVVERSFSCMKISRNSQKRSVVIPEINANVGEIPQNDDNGQLKSILVNSLQDANANRNVTNERKYPIYSDSPSDNNDHLKRDQTYDGCPVFRVIFCDWDVMCQGR